MNDTALVAAASDARRYAYAPYSNFPVGAALVTKSGKVFTGCNVENASLRLTICAEEAAIAAAIANGEKEFVAVAVVADSIEPVMPCGGCRQVLAEFSPELQVITSTVDGRTETFRLEDLLPRPKQGILESFRNV
jgi:cytidine deaminase